MQRPYVIVFASILPALLNSMLAAQQPTPATPTTPTAPAIDTKAPAKKSEVPVYDEAADARVQVAAAVATLLATFRWVSVTPLGKPVVPDE